MEKYLLLFAVFLVTWKIQSAAGHFKNPSNSQEANTPAETTVDNVVIPVLPQEENTTEKTTTTETVTKESPTEKTTTEKTTTKQITTVKTTTQPVVPKKECEDVQPSYGIGQVASCEIIKSKDDKTVLTFINLDEASSKSFYSFADRLKTIDAVGLKIESNMQLRAIDMPNLSTFSNSKGLYILSNRELKYVNIKVANSMTAVLHLVVESNPQLVSFLLRAHNSDITHDVIFVNNSELATILLNVDKIQSDNKDKGVLNITNNPKLESVYLRNLKEISDLRNMNIVNNIKLKTIDAPKLVRIAHVERFEISGNKNMVNITFPMLDLYHVTEFLISRNDRLETIIIGLKKKDAVRPTLNIQQNPMLTTIGIDMNVLIAINLNIRGNPKLDKKWLKELRELEKKLRTQIASQITIQMDGECIFENEIKDLSELDDCENIFGNLTLAENANGTWNAHIDTITGDTNFANYPLWQIEGVINHLGKVYSNRCDGPASDRVIRVGCATESPRPMDDMENITATTKAPQAPETFGPEDYLFEQNMEEPAAATQSSSLSERDTTLLVLWIIVGSFFALLLYLYHCRSYENGADLTGTGTTQGTAITVMEISAVDMAEQTCESA